MTTRHLFTAALAILGTSATALTADPVMLKVTHTQRPGTKLVDITCEVTATALEPTNAE